MAKRMKGWECWDSLRSRWAYVSARTKSEARARFKAMFGFKRRLPITHPVNRVYGD